MSDTRNTTKSRTRNRVRLTLTALGAVALASTLPTGTALADDETHVDSHNGHHVTLVSIGEIDDPAEDVLEHAAIFGSETSTVG
ncbi:hypothetical protein [Streptomyces uncialis]|uniref:hypothetical protein n=1 Tax=Streptomyces uncialis TaxID=1048205 RepID=UPI00340FEF6F